VALVDAAPMENMTAKGIVIQLDGNTILTGLECEGNASAEKSPSISPSIRFSHPTRRLVIWTAERQSDAMSFLCCIVLRKIVGDAATLTMIDADRVRSKVR
jgi:hypothetical protein